MAKQIFYSVHGIGVSIWEQFHTTVEWCPTIIPAEEGER